MHSFMSRKVRKSCFSVPRDPTHFQQTEAYVPFSAKHGPRSIVPITLGKKSTTVKVRDLASRQGTSSMRRVQIFLLKANKKKIFLTLGHKVFTLRRGRKV